MSSMMWQKRSSIDLLISEEHNSCSFQGILTVHPVLGSLLLQCRIKLFVSFIYYQNANKMSLSHTIFQYL